MTPLQAFQKMRELCEEYHLKFANVKPQTVEGYPIDNIEQALKALEIIKSKETLWVLKDMSGKCYIGFNTTAIEIPLKEYEILKEVLK